MMTEKELYQLAIPDTYVILTQKSLLLDFNPDLAADKRILLTHELDRALPFPSKENGEKFAEAIGLAKNQYEVSKKRHITTSRGSW